MNDSIGGAQAWINDDSVDPLTALLNRLLAQPEEAPFACPVCGTPESVHIHLHRFAGSVGGAWVWCSKCRRYDHDRRTVPGWWVNNLLVDVESLSSPPTRVDDLAEDVDRHWNVVACRVQWRL